MKHLSSIKSNRSSKEVKPKVRYTTWLSGKVTQNLMPHGSHTLILQVAGKLSKSSKPTSECLIRKALTHKMNIDQKIPRTDKRLNVPLLPKTLQKSTIHNKPKLEPYSRQEETPNLPRKKMKKLKTLKFVYKNKRT